MTEENNGIIRWATDEEQAALNGDKGAIERQRRNNVGGERWRAKFQAAKEHIGQWVAIYTSDEENYAYVTSYRIKRNLEAWVPNGAFKMRSRRDRNEDGVVTGSTLWIMFVAHQDYPSISSGSRGPLRGVDVPASTNPRTVHNRTTNESYVGLPGPDDPQQPVQEPTQADWDAIDQQIAERNAHLNG